MPLLHLTNIEEAKRLLSKIGYPPFGEKNNLSKKTKSYMNCITDRIKKLKT